MLNFKSKSKKKYRKKPKNVFHKAKKVKKNGPPPSYMPMYQIAEAIKKIVDFSSVPKRKEH
jgi:hypothetical protein